MVDEVLITHKHDQTNSLLYLFIKWQIWSSKYDYTENGRQGGLQKFCQYKICGLSNILTFTFKCQEIEKTLTCLYI